ncbi:MtrAB system histidine kinase MtrB [Ornithinimicrobium pratense]|uniref:Sensor histidine kinase MtrB n=1 Tax=Ornithinimicrobium pratense TaxID=2593973 RepID=A0A5J6V2R2_9MICO|nr:MtrAB system histidine kinase MtrB [Ornithinimicrobium pratense]QFG68015.1 HAMP domain-containing protein [Ornithinimicrobium pratense]
MASDTRPDIPEAEPRRRWRGPRWWLASLGARVITTTVLIGLVLAGLLGSVLYQQIAVGLVQQGTDSAQRDAAQQVALFQDAFDSTDRRDDSGLRYAAGEQVSAMAGAGPDGRRVLLLPSLSNDGGAIVEGIALGVTASDIPEALQLAVDQDPENQQVVIVPATLTGEEEAVTAVVVGSRVTLLRAGTYDLILIYPLHQEQETLDLVRQLFLAAGAGLVLLVAGLATIATRMVTRPVAEVAKVSRELAQGHLDERLPVHGTDEIAQLATSFNTMADSIQHQIRELRSLSQLQQRFVSDVSHELRTPLTTMRMAGAVLHASKEDFPLPVARSAELLDQELDRFEELLTELLEISRFDAGAVTVERHQEDIVPLVRSAVSSMEQLAQTHGSTIVLVVPEQPVLVSMDGRRISRVLRNLLSNALEHAEGGPVEVTVAATEHVVSCSVRDHGIGLTAEQQARVFDRFWRADLARTRTTGGTGLGLAIAKEDARVHGGWLQVGSVPGHGACFRLLLPRHEAFVIADRPPPVPLVTHDQPAQTWGDAELETLPSTNEPKPAVALVAADGPGTTGDLPATAVSGPPPSACATPATDLDHRPLATGPDHASTAARPDGSQGETVRVRPTPEPWDVAARGSLHGEASAVPPVVSQAGDLPDNEVPPVVLALATRQGDA